MDLHHGDTRAGVRNEARPQDAAASLDEPQVSDHTWALQICQDCRLARLHDEGILVETGLVPARDPSSAGCLTLGHRRQQISAEGGWNRTCHSRECLY